jgi:hypothetical protein
VPQTFNIDNELFAPFIIMTMQVESLEVLEKADVAPAQARAIIRAIEIELVGARETLATKQDLLLLRQDMRQDIEKLRREMLDEMRDVRGDMAGLRGELKAEIHASASSVTRQLYIAVLGQMAVLLGFSYFFATHVR